MKQYCLKIQSKNEKSLKNFLRFFFKHLKTKFTIIQKSGVSKANRKIITFLKSPHVNKTAQEHFEMHIFIRNIHVSGSFLEKTLIFLKKVLTRLFQDVSFDLEFSINKKISGQNNLTLFDPNNVRFPKKKNLQEKNLGRYRHKMSLKNSIHVEKHLTYFLRFLNTLSIFGEVLVISFLK